MRMDHYLEPVHEIKSKNGRDGDVEWQKGAFHAVEVDAQSLPGDEEAQ